MAQGACEARPLMKIPTPLVWGLETQWRRAAPPSSFLLPPSRDRLPQYDYEKDLKKRALLVRESDLVSTVQDRRHVLVVCSRTRLWWARAAACIMSVIPVRAVALVLGAECRLCLPQELRLRRVSPTNNAQES